MTNMKSNTRKLLCLSIICLCGSVAIAQFADGQPSKKTPSTAKPAATSGISMTSVAARQSVRKLFSSNKSVGLRATFDLGRAPYEVERYMGSQMAQPRFWKNRDSEGSTVLALQMLGVYGSEFIVPDLVEHIGFQLDPKTFRVGESRTVISLYAVAKNLSKINGMSVRRNVLQKLYRTESESEIRLCVWVLNETEGANVAEFIMDSALQNITQNVATEEVERATINLKRAKTLIRNPDSLLNFSAVK